MSEEIETLKVMNLTIQQLESDIKAFAERISEMRKDLKARQKDYMEKSLEQLEKV